MARVLLTSFEAFGGHDRNSSREAGRLVAGSPPRGVDLEWLVLPVVAGTCVEVVLRAILRSRPAVVLALGQSPDTPAVRLEELAINVDDFSEPDNAGAQPRHRAIVPDGPPAYRATLDLAAVAAGLSAAGIPAERGYHAGTFVCNHLYYGLLHHAAREGLPHRTAFVHLPRIAGQRGKASPWTADELAEAVRWLVAIAAAVATAPSQPVD
jgi:pyroglutamyl-peptidase